MSITKYSLEDLEKAIAFFKKQGHLDVTIELDDRGRKVIIKARDMAGQECYVSIFDKDTAHIATVTKTDRL